MNRKQRRSTQSQDRYKSLIYLRGRSYTIEEAGALAIKECSLRNFPVAADIYNLIVAKLPDCAEAYNNRGVALQGMKRYDEALANYASAAALRPDYADPHINRGNTFHALRKYAEALASYDRALIIKPDHVNARINRANTLQVSGRHAEALAEYDRAVALQPDYAVAYYSRGVALQETGRHGDALANYDKAIALNPTYADAHINRANALYAQRKYAEALAAYDRGIAFKPGDPTAHNGRGVALWEMRRSAEALASYDRAIALKPEFGMAHNNRAVALHGMKRHAEALASYDRAIVLRPDYAEAYNNRGLTLKDTTRYTEALADFDRAIALKPDYVTAHNNRSLVLQEMKLYDDALASCDRAIALKADYAEAHNNRGLILQEMKLYDDALASCDRAIALKPDCAEAYQNRGVILANKGDMREAEKMFLKVHELNPDLPAPLFSLTKIRTYQDAGHEDIKKIRTLANRSDLAPSDKDYLYFSLGKAYDDCGLYDEAFECYRRANEIRNAAVSYDANAVREVANRIIDVFDRDFLASPFPFGSDSRFPLFIVGMPRSGTTLVASILSNHRSVDTAGELPTVTELGFEVARLVRDGDSYPKAVRGITAGIASRLINDYEKRLRRDAGPNVAHVVDKNPLNFWHLGLISLLFPKARIIHCTRDPLDTCLSNYFQRFSLAYDFSFDLRNIGHFYGEYARTMGHWRKVLPVPMIEVSYEDVIADTERVTRELLGCLGLDWDERCLSPHTNPCAVETASNWQVRQPIYGQSVERWRHYEKHLAPLKEALHLP
jgi:tetratricopeptide (TPR) repeat protein